jgi:hypothetical protein
MKLRRRTLGGIAGIVVLGAIAAGMAAMQAGGASGPVLNSQALAALNSNSTKVDQLPASVGSISAAEAPAAGSVHRVGGGLAFAWVKNGKVCWAEPSGVGGCLPTVQLPIDYVIHDQDALGQGQPTTVSGLAMDGVESVTVTLQNGITATAPVTENFYVVSLPGNALPSALAEISAHRDNGSTWTQPISISLPSRG